MNILSATASESSTENVYNVAGGDRTSLNMLLDTIKTILENENLHIVSNITYRDFRNWGVRHSQALILKAKSNPSHNILDGLNETINWYLEK